MERSVPVVAHSYMRAFCNRSKKWENKSTATLVQKEGEICEGIAVRLTSEEVAKLDPFEGYPHKYNRFEIELTNCLDQSQFTGQAYIQVNPTEFEEPCDAYKAACANTILTHMKMQGKLAEGVISMPVVNALNGQTICKFETTASKLKDRQKPRNHTSKKCYIF